MPERPNQYVQRMLENELPDVHAEWLVNATKTSPHILKWIAMPITNDKEDFVIRVYEHFTATDSVYAIFDKTVQDCQNERAFAGIVSYVHTQTGHADTEFGIIILPVFQHTHVAANAVGLLLCRFLDPPRLGGLGLRRVQWRANVDNTASRRFASRMGFEFEGIARWDRVLPVDKSGVSAKALEVRNGTSQECPGRHSAIYSIVWDEWDSKRPDVTRLMQRKLNLDRGTE